MKNLGGDPAKINPLCPADLVIDHSVQVDVVRRYHPSRHCVWSVCCNCGIEFDVSYCHIQEKF